MKKMKILIAYELFLIVLLLTGILTNANAQAVGAKNIGHYPATFPNQFMDVRHGTDYIYVGQSTPPGEDVLVLSLDDPRNPTLIGMFDSPETSLWTCLDVNDAETIAVIGVSTESYVFNISDKNNATQIAEFNLPSAYDVEISGDLAYIACAHGGMPVVNITDADNPSIAYDGSYSGYTGGRLQRIFIDPDRDYIYGVRDDSKLLIFHLNSSKLPETPVSLNLSNDLWSVEKINNSLLAVGDSEGNIYFINITNLNSPSLLGSIDIGSWIYGLYYSNIMGTQLFAADYEDGLNVIDFSNVMNPINARVMRSTTGSAMAIEIDVYNNSVLLTTADSGLLVYRFSDCLGLGADGGVILSFNVFFLYAWILLAVIIIVYLKKRKNE